MGGGATGNMLLHLLTDFGPAPREPPAGLRKLARPLPAPTLGDFIDPHTSWSKCLTHCLGAPPARDPEVQGPLTGRP
jgi:hypothetical protein